MLPFYAWITLFLRAIAERYAVRVSRDMLHVTRRGLVLSRVAEIPADELEELRVSKPRPSCSFAAAVYLKNERGDP